MAVDVSQLPATGTPEAPPASPPPAAPAASGPATPSTAGRGQVEAQVALEPTPGTPEAAPAAEPEAVAPPPRPKLSELIKDPDYSREFEGIAGSRIQRAREETKAEVLRTQQANDYARFQADQKQAVDQEIADRANEDAWSAYYAQSGQPYELEEHTKRVATRRADYDQRARQGEAEARREWQVQQAGIQAHQQAHAEWAAANDALFRSLPRPVQEQLAGKPYYGSPTEAKASFQADVVAAVAAQRDAHWQADRKEAIEAGVKKERAKHNLGLPALDHGNGTATGGGPNYQFQEDAEADFVAGRIDESAMRLARRLPRRMP